MLLNEFELALEYQNDENAISNLMIKNDLEYGEASILYYNLTWKEKCRDFRLETRCISSMYSRLFPKFITKNKWKILIQCCENVFDERVISCEGVILTQVKINYEKYCRLSNKMKKEYALELLMDGIKKIADTQNWNTDPFIQTKDKIISLDYENTWNWKSVKNNSIEAKVVCKHDIDNISIFLIVSDLNGNIIYDQKIITDLPDEWAYSKYLGKLIIENETISLIDKNKKIVKSIVV